MASFPDGEILITGGAGFIGVNLAHSFLKERRRVHIFDNLSRAGVEANLADLRNTYPSYLLRVTVADVSETAEIRSAIRDASAVFHLAAQVAVTSSIKDPTADASVNLLGTLNVLEAIRLSNHHPPLLFTSTNKVYGRLRNFQFTERNDCWAPIDPRIAESGVTEAQPLEFLSPYGCSKGAADQYVLDYAHSYGLPATVFRMSCIYGPHQLGSEDQGWVAHFLRQALKRSPITIYGDGKQVRDLLFVDDLVSAMHLAINKINSVSGQAFNMGGGAVNATSLLKVIRQIEALTRTKLHVDWAAERLADQKWYVANSAKFQAAVGWKPTASITDGLSQMVDWYASRPSLIAQEEAQVA